jgi:uncharacterized protein YcgI (DUF1989 family)
MLMTLATAGTELDLTVSADDVCAFDMAPGQFVSVTAGGAAIVASLFTFTQADRSEWLSVADTRLMLGTLYPRPGHRLFSNRRRALLVWAADSCGRHDLLMPVGVGCAAAQRELWGQRLGQAFSALGADGQHPPDPLNLYLNTDVQADGRIHLRPPNVRAGDRVVLCATTAVSSVILAWRTTPAQPERAILGVSVRNVFNP